MIIQQAAEEKWEEKLFTQSIASQTKAKKLAQAHRAIRILFSDDKEKKDGRTITRIKQRS